MYPTLKDVSLGDSEFAIKGKMYRYEDIMFTFGFFDAVQTGVDYGLFKIPTGKQYSASVAIGFKNGDTIAITDSNVFHSKAKGKKLMEFYGEFLRRSFKFRWQTYLEIAQNQGYFSNLYHDIYPDGRVFWRYSRQAEAEFKGQIQAGDTARIDGLEVMVGSLSIGMRPDPDIVLNFLEAYFELKFVD